MPVPQPVPQSVPRTRIARTRVARTRGGHVWGEVWRVGAALLVGLGVWAAVQAELEHLQETPNFGEAWPFIDIMLGVVAAALLLWRRRWPVTIAIVTTLLSGISTVALGCSALALVSLSTRRRWREVLAVAVPWAVAGWLFEWVYRPSDRGDTLTNVAIGVLSYVAAVGIGWAIGERRGYVASLQERALTAEREQAMRVAQARLGERTRIAREMHDVLAHRISLVAMHSGALTYRTDLTRDEVAETAEIVRVNANRALTELRAVLGVLRDQPIGDGLDESANDAPEPPQPTLDDLDELLADARSTGARVALDRFGELGSVPPAASRHAYRILQECLTNARKHAPGMPISVTLARRGKDGRSGSEGVLLMVHNGIRHGGGDTPPGAGLGLLGLTERAVLAGGELTHGRDRAGNFVVTAWLPWAA